MNRELVRQAAARLAAAGVIPRDAHAGEYVSTLQVSAETVLGLIRDRLLLHALDPQTRKF